MMLFKKMFINTRLLRYSKNKSITIMTISYAFQIIFLSFLPIQDIVFSSLVVDLGFPQYFTIRLTLLHISPHLFLHAQSVSYIHLL